MRMAALFMFLSGAASLVYQVAWVRLLGLSMGATSASVSAVLAAFFLGLAAGSAVAGRLLRGGRNPLRVYLVLEATIGLSGLLLLPVLLRLDHVMALLPAVGSQQWFKVLFCLLILGVPTVCMGATWPVLAAALVRRQSEIGFRLGQLYALNTAGAMAGAASSGFLLAPALGLDGAVVAAAILNFTIVAIGVVALRRRGLETAGALFNVARENKVASEPSPAPNWRWQSLVVLATTGVVSIAAEVGWTKILAVITGATLYGFSTILAAFLFGIALGSWVAKSHLERIRRPEIWMVGGLLALGLTLHLTRSGLVAVPAIQMQAKAMASSPMAELLVKVALSFLLILVPTCILGALFPLCLKLYCRTPEGIRTEVGRAYAVNTLAGVVGSVGAGLWIIPRFGTDWLLAALGTATILVSAMLILSLEIPIRTRIGASLAFGVLSIAALLLPALDYEKLIDSVEYKFGAYAKDGRRARYLFVREGRAGLISLVTYDERHVFLQNDGIKEGWVDLQRQSGPRVELLLGLVPCLFHPEPRSAFVVGFGAGATVEALAATDLEEIHVAELEPLVIRAMESVRPDAKSLFGDPRLRITYNDARNTLLVGKRKYDIIVSQPSHPWRAGAGNLFTREYFEIVRSRLHDRGIVGLWVNLFNIDATTLKSILRAFHETFAHGFSLAQYSSGDLLLFGSQQPMLLDQRRAAARADSAAVRDVLRSANLRDFRNFLGLFALSGRQALEVTRDTAPNTDTAILSETRWAASDGKPPAEDHPYLVLKRRADFDVAPYLGQPEAAGMTLSYALQLLREGKRDEAIRVARHLEGMAPDLLRRFEAELRGSTNPP